MVNLDLKDKFHIFKISSSDIENNTDNWHTFANLVLENEESYPNINQWLADKVIPGLIHDERLALIGFYEELPIATAILKKGYDTKLCHLKINDNFQDKHLGQLFFSIMAAEVKDIANELHFTLPESLWATKKGFFESFGFNNAIKSITQYRNFDYELRCSASFDCIWSSVLDILPNLFDNFYCKQDAIENSILFSIKPSYADKIFKGDKTIEIRRKFSNKWIGHKACVYASSPVSGIVGEVKIDDVIVDEPECIWTKYESEIGCSKDQYDEYVGTASEVYAIRLTNVNSYKHTINLDDTSIWSEKKLTPPQSYSNIYPDTPWDISVSIAQMINCLLPTRDEIDRDEG